MVLFDESKIKRHAHPALREERLSGYLGGNHPRRPGRYGPSHRDRVQIMVQIKTGSHLSLCSEPGNDERLEAVKRPGLSSFLGNLNRF